MDESHSLTERGPDSSALPNGRSSPESPGLTANTRPDERPEPTASNQTGIPPRRTVPYGALAEERARRKELQRELQTAMEARQRLQGRLDLLHDLAQQQGAPVDANEADVARDEATAPEPAAQETGDAVEAQAESAFRTQLMVSVRDFVRDRPDFLDAYQHAREARVSELVALGYAPQEALSITFDNELEIIQNAYTTGRNPAHVIYDYARQRGYRGGESAAVPVGRDAAAASRGNAMSEAEKVAMAARGQAASKSLSAAAGGSTGTLTLEALAGMSDEEFAEATRGDRWHRLLKGSGA